MTDLSVIALQILQLRTCEVNTLDENISFTVHVTSELFQFTILNLRE